MTSHDVVPLDPARPRESAAFLRGLALFARGAFFEAHEEWEALWHAAGRQGDVAALLKALIRLAAAGVKAQHGNARGVRSHAEAAARLLDEVRRSTGRPVFCGLDLDALSARAHDVAGRADDVGVEDALRGAPVDLVEQP